jgi:hypothetical protein
LEYEKKAQIFKNGIRTKSFFTFTTFTPSNEGWEHKLRLKNVVLVIAVVMVLSGCWDHREIAEITVVVGMAVDKDDDDKFILTVEGINAKELSDKTASGFAPSIVFSLKGDTLAELSQKMNIGIANGGINYRR